MGSASAGGRRCPTDEVLQGRSVFDFELDLRDDEVRYMRSET